MTSRLSFPWLGLIPLLATGCQQEMAQQPYYRPLEPSAFFKDGRSARPLVPGTIPRGRPVADSAMLSGRANREPEGVRAAAFVGQALGGFLGAAALLPVPTTSPADYVTAFPFPITAEALERGQERYTIFCAVCHDPTGNGNGKIVERGYVHPPSYVTDYSRGFERRGIKLLLRDAPVGYFFEVVTEGFGAMPDYAEQVPAADRWKIAAYIRALQLSQYARLQDLPEEQRKAVQKALEGTR